MARLAELSAAEIPQIDPRELKEAMTSLGLDAKSGTVYAMISAFDRDADKRIDFAEFVDLMTAKMVRRGVCVLCVCGARACVRASALVRGVWWRR